MFLCSSDPFVFPLLPTTMHVWLLLLQPIYLVWLEPRLHVSVSTAAPYFTSSSSTSPLPCITLARKIVLLLPLLLLLSSFPVESASARSHEAYVTLLYGDEFVLGVRVLGKSIRDTGTTKDMVVLGSDGVSDYAKDLLQADGWIVEKISLLANPNRVRPTRFWGAYTKLKIFNLTNYKKVVYLDADTIVVKSIEDLFKCGKFCANLKHSERLNSGVMVVEPSEKVFKDMMSKVNSLESYTGGDQGFLNSYYTGFANAHIFEPDISPEVLKSRPVPEMERLSTLYNADVGLYMLANKWMVNENELRVIHYTLGPLKPWDWWTSWLLKPVDVWQAREQLDDSLPGTDGGCNPKTKFLVKFLFILPVCSILLWCNKSLVPTRDRGSISSSSLWDQLRHLLYKIRCNGTYAYRNVSTSSTVNFNQQFPNGGHMKVPGYLNGLSIVVCFMAGCVAFLIAIAIIPRQVRPRTGLLLMNEWTFTIFYTLFRGYLEVVYKIGRAAAIQLGANSSRESSEYDSGKGHQRHTLSFDLPVWFYWLGMAVLAIVTPALPCSFGITALFARLGLMVGGGIVLASFMTYASEQLAMRYFIRGFEERDSVRGRSICFIC